MSNANGTLKRPVEWMYHTNIYEVNFRQYTREGTFNAFLPELPRLREMGVETLWFMPVMPIAKAMMKGTMGSYYACSDYTAINPEFGSLDDFKKLVSRCHELGFKVILDWVANHTGWDHVWTTQHPEYFERDEKGNFKAASGMDDIIELDYNNPELVKAMIAAMKFWVETCNIDGFRCDLAAWVKLDFWETARPELEKIKPLFWLGEFDVLENPDYMQVFDVAYAWRWMHTTETFYKTQRNVGILRELLRSYADNYPPQTTGLYFTSNHDENSWNGTEFEKYGEMAMALAVFSFTWAGVPLLYSGQELPNTKRLKFFDKDVIAWNGRYELSGFFKKLLGLHSINPALAFGGKDNETKILTIASDDHILAFYRKSGNNIVLVLLNFSPYPSAFNISGIAFNGSFTELFTEEKRTLPGKGMFQLNAWGYKVYVCGRMGN
jgi:glycosidase